MNVVNDMLRYIIRSDLNNAAQNGSFDAGGYLQGMNAYSIACDLHDYSGFEYKAEWLRDIEVYVKEWLKENNYD